MDLNKLKRTELITHIRIYNKDNSIKGYSKLKKKDLIELISKHSKFMDYIKQHYGVKVEKKIEKIEKVEQVEKVQPKKVNCVRFCVGRTWMLRCALWCTCCVLARARGLSIAARASFSLAGTTINLGTRTALRTPPHSSQLQQPTHAHISIIKSRVERRRSLSEVTQCNSGSGSRERADTRLERAHRSDRRAHTSRHTRAH